MSCFLEAGIFATVTFMRTLRTVGGIALALLLSLSGFAVTEASPYLVIKKAAYYEVPDYSGFPADIVKDILKAEGVKPKFESTTGGRARATQDWLVVKTEPATGKKIKLGKRKPKVTVIVRKVDETATGITGKAAAKKCEDHADSEFRFGQR